MPFLPNLFYKILIELRLLALFLASFWQVNAQYCTPVFSSGCASGDQINSFEIPSAGFSHLNTGCSAGAYEDFSATYSITLQASVDYAFSVTHGYSGQFVRIYADFNNDSTFDETTELIGSGGSLTLQVTNGTLKVPATVAPGSYRMRIVDRWNSAPLACNLTGFGEAHDYTLVVTPPPTCLSPATVTASNITTTTADVNWAASTSAPANGYDVYYSASTASPTAATVPSFSGVAGLTTTLSGLTPNTDYYVWVRSVCSGSDQSLWSNTTTFKTACGAAPYMFENFDSYATGNIVPTCWSRIISGSGSQSISSSAPASGSRNIYQYSSTPANSTIVVLPVFSNINAGTHQVRFKAKATTAPGTLEVGYVTDATDASTFVLVQSLSIATTVYNALSEYSVPFPSTVPANARVAVRNPGATTASYYWDDVYWEPAPTCLPPLNINATISSPTSVDVSWTASTTPPGGGYDVFVSTTNTPPTAATIPTVAGVTGTTTSITGLTPNTPYFAWVRSNCTGGDLSSWSLMKTFNTPCQPPALISTSIAPTPVCLGGTATLSATADAGATVNWYDAATGGNLLASGNSYTTPILTSTTNYWVSAAVGSTGATGKDVPVSTSGNSGFNDVGLMFDALTNFTLTSVDLYPLSPTSTAGTVTIALKTSTGTILQSATVNVNVSPTGVLNTVPLNFDVPAGTNHRLVVTAVSGVSNLIRESTSGFAYPYTLPGVCSITSAYTSGPSASYYYYLYNWHLSTLCSSPRTMLTATYDPTCTMGTSEVDGKDKISISPNPFSDFIRISDVKDVVSVSIIDLSGRVVKTVKPANEINLGDLKTGMYLINLKMKDGSVQTVKAVKK